MKKKIFSSVLIFMFAWVAVGALDCGCAFASPIETKVHKAAKTSEGMDCHGSEEAQSKKSEDVCCSGCELESKAPFPPSITLTGPTQNNLSELTLNVFKSGPTAVALVAKSTVSSSSFQGSNAQGVSIYGAPIYLAVQSFLI